MADAEILRYTGYALAALAVWIVLRCARSLLLRRPQPEVWGCLELPDGRRIPVRGRECVVGCSRLSDAVIDDPSVEKSHAALLRNEDGDWTAENLCGKVLSVAGKAAEGSVPIRHGDRLQLGNVKARFVLFTDAQRRELGRAKRGAGAAPAGTLLLLSVFQLTALLQLCAAPKVDHMGAAAAFGLLCAAEWFCYFASRGAGERRFEPEILAFFLTTVGFVVAASSAKGALLKQSLLFLGALALFYLLGLWLRSLRRVRALRWVMGAAALGFLGLTLLTSEAVWGAKNWLIVAGQSLQPSEFVKIAYVYAGAAAMDRLFRRRELLLFIVFSALCVGVLALMGDFGTALVFFVAFLVISYMRSGSFATVLLAVSGAVLAVMLVLAVKPYVAARFAGWGHAWDDPMGAGFQQVRAMSALASGGLFGRGAGGGWLRNVVAADTDLVFGLVCEELGLITGICCVLALSAALQAGSRRSAYDAIASCAAVTMYLTQMGLNVFGSMDLLPFTGVTFPFLSRGGSSLIACWGLLAFLKAGELRPGDTGKKASAAGASPAKKVPGNKPAPAKKPAAKKLSDSGKAPAAKKPVSGKKPGGKGAAK